MEHSWNEIKEIIEKIEADRAARSLVLEEEQEGHVRQQATITTKSQGYLGFLGGLSLGITMGVFAMIFNYIVFVYFLHIEF